MTVVATRSRVSPAAKRSMARSLSAPFILPCTRSTIALDTPPGAPRHNRPRQVLVRCRVLPVPEPSRSREGLELPLHLLRHVPIGEPRWIANENVNPVLESAQPGRT